MVAVMFFMKKARRFGLVVAITGIIFTYVELSQFDKPGQLDVVSKQDVNKWLCLANTPKQITRNLNDIKVLCLIFTMPANWNSKAKSVRDTWSRRCDKVIFIYSRVDGFTLPSPALAIDAPEGIKHLTTKIMLALDIAYKTYGSQFDWFLKADDDVYIIMDNLKYLLSHYNASEPHYVGRLFPLKIKHGFNSGGAGYLLSRPAMKILVSDRNSSVNRCKKTGALEDLDLGRCLARYGLFPEITTDENCRLKFHDGSIAELLMGDKYRLSKYRYEKHKDFAIGNLDGAKVLSPYTVSFHRTTIDQMYMYDFLLHDLRRPGGCHVT